MSDDLKSKDLAMQVQKKILGKMASKSFSKMLIDERTSEILDELYKVLKEYRGRKTATKLIKDLMKIMIKIGVLQRNERFTADELRLAEKLHSKTKHAALTIVSFYEVEFTFDKYVLSKQITEGRNLVHQLVTGHLKAKSKERINAVFDLLSDVDFLERLFERTGVHRAQLDVIATRIKELIDNDVL